MAYELLLQEAEGMSDARLMEVIRFMRFIKKDPDEHVYSVQSKSSRSNWIRTPGGLSGKIMIAEGFDDPIEGFEEYQ